jgi:hypothetical protein
MKTNLFSTANFLKNLSVVALIFLCSCSKTNLPKDGNLKTDIQQNGIAASPNGPTGLSNIPLYRYWNNSGTDHFYTITQGNYPGWVFEKIECYVLAFPQFDFVPFYRYWNGKKIDHFYTTVSGNYSGYVYEGIEGYISPVLNPPGSTLALIPLYRYFNGGTVDHFYTVTPGNFPGYAYEGIAGYVLPYP